MGVGHHTVIFGKTIQIGPVYPEKFPDRFQQLINALVDGAETEVDEFGGQARNQPLETSLKGKLSLALAETLLQVLVMLDVVELAVPEGAAIRLALRLRVHFEPLIIAVL